MSENIEAEEKPPITARDYERSRTLGKFAKAMAAAQLEMDNAEKGAANPHFKSRYADLADVINACKLPLAKNEIARLQLPCTKENGDVGIRTELVHSSDEYVAFTFWCKPQQAGPQALGSVLTYLRRYGLAAAVGVGQEDDDGNAGSVNGNNPPPRDREPARPAQQAPQTTKSGGGLAKPNATAAGTIADPDPEHEKNLKKIRDVVGRDLGWEAKRATAEMQSLFGVDSTTKLSKPQASVFLQLVLAASISKEAYEGAIEKARLETPALFAARAA